MLNIWQQKRPGRSATECDCQSDRNSNRCSVFISPGPDDTRSRWDTFETESMRAPGIDPKSLLCRCLAGWRCAVREGLAESGDLPGGLPRDAVLCVSINVN